MSKMTAIDYFQLATTLVQLGDYRQARDNYFQFLATNPREDEYLAIALQNTGICAKKIGDYEQALTYYNKSLDLAKKLSLMTCQADNISNIAVIIKNQAKDLLRSGKDEEAKARFKEALSYYEQAITIDRKENNLRGLASDLNNLGITYTYTCQYSRAIGAFEESMDLANKANDSVTYAKAVSGIGNVYKFSRNWSRAIQYLEQAEKLLKSAKGPDLLWAYASSKTNLGIARFEQGEVDTAFEHFREALAIFKALGIEDDSVASIRTYMSKCPSS